MNLGFELPPIPLHTIGSTLKLLYTFLNDILLYLAHAIAIVSIIKFTVYLINGFTEKSYMGSSPLGYSSS